MIKWRFFPSPCWRLAALALFAATAHAGITLRVVRPEPGEALTLSQGRTFVIGTVTPGSAVSCNGQTCQVEEDGAFFGFVPIQEARPWLEKDGKPCDASFEFTARSGDETTIQVVPVITPRSPAAALVAQEVLDPPGPIRLLKDRWIGLEGPCLGQLLYLPKGSILSASFAGGGAFRCRLEGGLEVSIPETEAEPAQGNPPCSSNARRITSEEDGHLRVTSLDGQTTSDATEGKFPWGFSCQPNEKDTPIFAATPPPLLEPTEEKPLRGLRVVLDPGHHPDRGAVGPRGFEERESNLLLAREVAGLLRAEGAEAFLTREENPLPLLERHARIHALHPHLVVSLHNNSVGDGEDPRKRHGTQTFYLYPWSRPLAESVHAAILRELGTTDMGCHRRNLYLPRFHECPAILIEPEYLILPEREKKFMSADQRQRLAGAIVEGIREFVSPSFSVPSRDGQKAP